MLRNSEVPRLPCPVNHHPHTPEERQVLLEELCSSGVRTPEWWKNVLLGYEEMPDYPAQIAGEMDIA